MSFYKLPVVLEPQPEGGYTITCPLVPGLITEADTFDEVIPNVTDAVAALIKAYEDLNFPLPPALHSDTGQPIVDRAAASPMTGEEFEVLGAAAQPLRPNSV